MDVPRRAQTGIVPSIEPHSTTHVSLRYGPFLCTSLRFPDTVNPYLNNLGPRLETADHTTQCFLVLETPSYLGPPSHRWLIDGSDWAGKEIQEKVAQGIVKQLQ